MAAFASLSELVNRMSGGNSGAPEVINAWVDSRVAGAAATATVAGRWSSLYTYNKTQGGGGTAPTTVAAPTRTDNGGLLQTNPAGGRTKYLLGASVMSTAAGTFMLYDRLLHIGNLSGTTTTAQTVGGTITRNTGGVGNQIWLEIYTIIGTTATTVTASYTNQAGTSGRTTQATAFGGTGLREVTRMIPLPLQAGDTGVQSVQSVTVLASTTTAGAFGVTLVKPIITGSIPIASAGFSRDMLSGFPNLQSIDTDACLCMTFLANGTTAPQLMTSFSFAEI